MKPRPTQAQPAFTSRLGSTEYRIYVEAFGDGAAPRPAVLLMDGDFSFEPAAEAARELFGRGLIPPVVVAAVGYGAGFGQPGNRRGRDYTPVPAPEAPDGGGADAFLAHLRGSLWDELGRRHPLERARSVLAGHSLGSLLVLHALFQPEPFFGGFLAGAPSLWWADREFLGRVERFRERTAALPARLFLGAGVDETPSMIGDLKLFEELLARRPFAGLEVESVRFPGRNHYDVLPDLFRAGFRSLLG